MSGFSTFFGERINNKDQLANLINLESKKLGLNPKNISGVLGEIPDLSEITPNVRNQHTAYVHKKGDSNYEIILENMRTNNALRHELYHIYDDSFSQKGKYTVPEMLLDEFQANIYAATGIKTSFKHL